ncbi:tetratricopeptide repeat protein, partial [Chamaesiphon sp. VAR_69_metabat_338]|uniref:tetratricopeptide repeat protein n=1 Tax=Chamaesiphon sp. VAR_69_metabat_338 TaxID=2964704 RepID=UPI00286E1E4D
MQSGYLLRNRYLIENRLSAGGFGETYIAVDKDYPDRRRVVVKHLKPQSNDPALLDIARRLFETEAKTLAKLGEKTDLIPTLYAYFEENREFYLVQELIEGQTLTQELGTQKLSDTQTLKVVREILAVLTEVHIKRIVHRDLKPDNIIRRSHDRKLILIDFGAVKAVLQTTLNASNAKSICIGTAGYMPTEQAMGYPTSASDIYAVGAIALQCLTGKHPLELFDEDDLAFKWQHLCSASDRVIEILSKMVAAKHLDRYPNAMEAIKAIDPVLQSVRSYSQPPTQSYHPPITNSSPDPIASSTPKAPAKTKLDRQKSIGLAACISLGFIGLIGLLNSIVSPKILTANDSATSQTPASDSKQSSPDKDNTSVIEKDEKDKRDSLEALAKYDRAIEINPQDADAYINRGLLKYEKNDTQGALADYNRAIKINPKDAIAHYNRGTLKYNKLNDNRGALADFNRAIEINPQNALAYINRGLLKYSNLNDDRGALSDYNRAIEINPQNALAYINRGNLKYKTLNDNRGALADFNRAIEINPQNALA